MATVFGVDHDARSLAERCGGLAQVGGIRLVTLGDGAGRGVRLLEVTTGSGLAFSIMVDRAMDIADLSHSGRGIGWRSAVGIRHPGLHEPEGEDGLGWTRSFTGFLATCGLDHILGAEDVPADTYDYPRRDRMRHGLHGRIGATPARLTGYGEVWEGDRCVLWAEGVVVQAAIFGEVLHLHRRIEVDLGGDTIRLHDRVVNAGFSRTPHMFLYHVNLGYPLIDAGSRYVAPVRQVIWASHADRGLEAHGVGYRTCPDPIRDFTEQVWQHDMAPDGDGTVAVAVVNDRLGFGLLMETQATQFPCALQWQNFRSGNYVMGIEPSTHHVRGNLFAREREEMIWLDAGDERRYNSAFTVLAGPDAVSRAETRIAGAARQPDHDFPEPTGRFPPLRQPRTA